LAKAPSAGILIGYGVTPTLQRPEGKQHGKSDTIIWFHIWGHPENSHLIIKPATISNYYLNSAMLFMQLRGLP
jgi:hypothetical protein